MMIRKAKVSDALKIHEVHMKSIQDLCSVDHTLEEIKAWGHRPFNEQGRINAINNQYVFVVEDSDVIEGFLHFNILESKSDAYIYGLYLSKKIKGFGFGKKLINYMFEILKEKNITKITLHSTLTAHKFYQHMGFTDSGPIESVMINNTPIRSIPMNMEF